MTETRRAGVIGHPVGHSLSPVIHNAAFSKLGIDAEYAALDAPTEEDALEIMRRLHDGRTLGFNVTMPYKWLAFSICDDSDEAARAVGGVNTLVLRDGRIVGANTDPVGFVYALREAGAALAGRAATVLGTGPTALSAVRALTTLGAGSITVVSRTPSEVVRTDIARAGVPGWGRDVSLIGYDDVEAAIGESSVLIDTTPLGMRPGDPCPVPAHVLHTGLTVIDAVYGAGEPTALLDACAARGILALDGLRLLVGQAARSFELFLDLEPGTAPIAAMLAAALAEMDRRRA